MAIDVLGYLYAAAVAAGGIAGYVKAGSRPSLSAGLVFGAALGVGAYLRSLEPPRPLMQLGTSFFLASMMGARWCTTGKFMPAGIVFLLSSVIVLRNILSSTDGFRLREKEPSDQ